LKALHNAGGRGARVLSAARADIEPFSARIPPLGWHLQISLPGSQIVEIEAVLCVSLLGLSWIISPMFRSLMDYNRPPMLPRGV
jgi:hypothetical protein